MENAKAEIQRMQHEKEHFEDSMKKAFMRGVCALNLEAMTIFQNRSDTGWYLLKILCLFSKKICDLSDWLVWAVVLSFCNRCLIQALYF